MTPVVAEFIGTAILVLLGNGSVANVLLARTKGHDSGFIVITAAWGLAVFVAVFCVAPYSGAHINPAVSIGLAVAGDFPWDKVPGYVTAQMAGGIAGAALVWLFYKNHYGVTGDADAKLATFCTTPAIRDTGSNLLSEMIGTFMLLFPILLMAEPSISVTLNGDPATTADGTIGLGTLGALPVGLLVFAIGMSLGGTTGYAINPARDLGPRIAHTLLPVAGKRDSDWSYSWIPVAGPVAGALLAALTHGALVAAG